MNSINENQPEENRADLSGPGAVGKIKELVGRAETCHFRTSGAHKSRPMNVRQVDDRGNLWFLAADDSYLVRELTSDASAELYFQGSPHSDFLFLEGRATTSRDQRKTAELWKPLLKTWFTQGVDDPRITVIEFVPTKGYYWDTKHGGMVAGLKVLFGAATGVTLDDSIEGTLDV